MQESIGTEPGACEACLRRAELLSILAGHISIGTAGGRRVAGLLALSDKDLVEAVVGGRRGEVWSKLNRFDAQRARRHLSDHGLGSFCRHGGRYPELLRQLPDAPAALFLRGDQGRLRLLEGPCVAVVGARKATPYGLEVARSLGHGLASAGVTVVSGLAFGIDAAAHRGALDASGNTVSVLGGGADRSYPRSQHSLYEEICANGLVLSEFPLGFRPRKWCFPARNRIMAGLSLMTVVVEASERSGALITAEFACGQGREVGAVPGPVNSHCSAGANALIADGARLVRGAEDVLDEIQWDGQPRAGGEARKNSLDGRLESLLARVERGLDTVDRLVAEGAGATEVVTGLGELELLGLVKRSPTGRYLRTLG